ncbi:Calpain catalytic domain-containing protein [Mycena indigotica]|uniref:Calpain catalytic domain-containing protein n=1 Tax=Mycena indigotica TaxID=2126181 RepID=A0A8H6VTC1_9AGAR|nr:Calpain catalytic domain-containing protein [Mycena indigotica]KAF7289323.1 Calpain catalytic domain-containing protein [Mycena indigotica]
MPSLAEAEVCLPSSSAKTAAYHRQSTYAKAVKGEYNKDFDTAFRLYVKAAEAFLYLSRAVDNQHDKTKHKSSAGKALERAEKLKGFLEKSKPESALTPVAVDHFSPHEQFYVLQRGKTVNGRVFPSWDEQRDVSEFSASFRDPDGEVGLSPEQQKLSPQWRRPVAEETLDADSRLQPQDILQHIITDCSVCASISVCLEHSARFGSEFGNVLLHNPKPDESIVTPIISQPTTGRYDLRLLLNGGWRRAHERRSRLPAYHATVIDDTLPYHPGTGALVCMSSSAGAIWPSLLEKGYMKLMGGYDFPGSNSGIDLHALIGWIPEHLEIKSPFFERERTWKRILDAFVTGQCMLTLGTGVDPNLTWCGVSLLSSHCYAVIDITESEDTRTLTVLDSWVRPPQDSQTQDCRVRHIPWSDVVGLFDSIYLSWDPHIWPNSLTFHGIWKQANQRSTRNLRLKYQSTDECEVVILLTRHVSNTRATTDFVSLRVQLVDQVSDVGDSHHTIAAKDLFTNNPHVLMRTTVPAQSDGLLSVFASYDGPTTEVGFTLSVYAPSCATVAWDEHVQTPPFSSKARAFFLVEGTLMHKNAGGNSTHPTFMVNPQYHLRIKQSHLRKKAEIALTMQMAREVPINIVVVWSQGQRVFELTQKDVAATSGAYSYGLARVSKLLQGTIGDYTVILSAFEPNQMGPFSLEVESSLAFELKTIPQEGAGMYFKSIRGAWNGQNAMGSPSFKNYAQNPVFEVEVPTATEIKMRLQLLRPTPSSAINLTLFTASLGQQLLTSGGYDDNVCGVVTPQIKLSPGKYWAVPSTYSPNVHGPFQILVYTTAGRVDVAERRR